MTPNKLGTKRAKFFFEICKEKFKYLIKEFNFSVVSTRKDGSLYEIIFQNKTTAVIVNWERSENWIYIELYRLVNGKLVTDPTNISSKTEINGYYLDDLLSIRHPSFSPARFPVDDKDIVEVITNYAAMLHQQAADVLNGDFTIFYELEKIVKNRIVSNK
jgi:hypothetical protein